MQKHLFFVCPTDNLESVINFKFKHENYFLTSLGNSFEFNKDNVKEINTLIRRFKITEIIFILAENNKVIHSALNNQEFSHISGITALNREITSQKKILKKLWEPRNLSIPIISFHLINKVKELKIKMRNLSIDQLKVRAKIYRSQENIFTEIHRDLLFREQFVLN